MNPAPLLRRLAGTVLLLPAIAMADPIQWEITDGVFDDDGTFSGSFVYDFDTDTFSNWAISIEGGREDLFPPIVLTPENSTVNRFLFSDETIERITFRENDTNRQLRITPSSELDSADAPIPLDLEASGRTECFNCAPFRNIISGVLNPGVGLLILTPEGLSGNWFDPALAGEGFNIIQTEFGLIVFYFGSGTNGEPLWLISEPLPGEIQYGQELVLSMLRTDAGTYAMPAMPEDFVAWGTLNIIFETCLSGSATLSGIDGDKVAAIQKLVGVGTLNCDLPLGQAAASR